MSDERSCDCARCSHYDKPCGCVHPSVVILWGKLPPSQRHGLANFCKHYAPKPESGFEKFSRARYEKGCLNHKQDTPCSNCEFSGFSAGRRDVIAEMRKWVEKQRLRATPTATGTVITDAVSADALIMKLDKLEIDNTAYQSFAVTIRRRKQIESRKQKAG